jgi:FHS family glucose/mannose:H+ symporter-like MFS transporter
LKAASPRLQLALAYLTFLLFGAFFAAIGPVLGELSVQTSSTLAVIGGILTFLFLGSLVAQLAAGPLVDRLGLKPVMVVSLIILGIGLLGFMSASAIGWMFFLALFAGLGQGGVDMGSNLVVTDAAPRNSTSALNLLHFFFGAGAFIGPALVGLAIAATGSGLVVHRIVAILFLVVALAMLVLLRSGPHHATASAGPESASAGLNVYLSPLLWLMSALILVYVGVEFGLGSWISSYLHLTASVNAEYGALATSAYWAALAIGRLVGAALSARLPRFRLLATALGSSFIGAIGLFFTHAAAIPTVLCLVWISFSYGTVYPTTVALATDSYPRDQGKALSILVATGNIGGITLPWIAGVLLSGPLPITYLWFVAVGILVLLLLLSLIRRFESTPTAASA